MLTQYFFFNQSGSCKKLTVDFCNSCPKSLSKIKDLVILSIFFIFLMPEAMLENLGNRGGWRAWKHSINVFFCGTGLRQCGQITHVFDF